MNQILAAPNPATIVRGAPYGVHPVLHALLWPARFILMLASTVAVLPIFVLSMSLHVVRVILGLIPGVRPLANFVHGRYHAFIGWIGKRVLIHESDEPILAAVISLTVSAGGVFLAQLILYKINWYLVIAFYIFVYGPKIRGFVRSFSAWHQEIHRPTGGILKGPSPFERTFGFSFFAFLLGLPMGLIQSGVAHVHNHHRENGNYFDAFGSAQYNHANLWHFVRYMTRDVFHQIFLTTPAAYFLKRQRGDLALVQLKANLLYFAVVVPVFFYSWQIGVLYVLVPWLATVFMLGLVNWTQHPFYGGRDDSLNYMTNTLTVLETPVNFLYEGYHLAHHHRSGRHWTENPQLFEDMRAKMKAADSIVLRDVGVTEVFLLLTVFRAFGFLARKYEPWEPMSHAEKKEHLRNRSNAAPAHVRV